MWNPWDHSECKESNVKTIQTASAHGMAVWNKFHCSVLKEILWFFTPLNYIQTFKIQIFFRNVGHALLLHIHILKKALELRVTQQTWQYLILKDATTLKKSNHRKAKKKKRVVLLYVFHCLLTKRYGKISAKIFFFIKLATIAVSNSCLMYKKHQITALDSKDALLLGYSKNRSKKFDIKDTEGWTYNKCLT